MKQVKFFVFLTLALLMAAAPIFAGGGGQSGGSSASSGTSGVTGSVTYPIKTDVTLTYWQVLDLNVSANYPSMGDTPFARGLQERTGIKIQYLHPPANSSNEQFNLMVADGNLPDIMERSWISGYPGGPEKAISDGVILRLNDIFEKYCPNITAYLKANPDIDRMIKTDNGSYYCFPFIRGDEWCLISSGLMVRQDWLDDLGLPMPTTIDEWHTTLKAFKEKKNAPAPLALEYGTQFIRDRLFFSYAYHAWEHLYVGDDGKIHYGAIEDGFRQWLTTFAAWYKEGLVDPDLVTQQLQQISAKVINNQTGAVSGTLGSRMGTWLPAARATNPKFKLVGAPIPTLRKGDPITFQTNIDLPFIGAGAAISGSSKNVELAARLLDWSYSPAGILYYNFGIEGESYTMVKGEPIYTDLILKNPQGRSIGQSLAAYIRATDSNGPMIQDGRYQQQYFAYPEQKDAVMVWAGAKIKKYSVPPITPTPEESREYAQIMSDITTYRDEMFVKYILGTESLSNWSTFVSTVNRMGLDRALAIQNAALARYNAR